MTIKERYSRLGAICISAALGSLAVFPLSHALAGDGYSGGGGGDAASRELARRQGLLLDAQEQIAQGQRLAAEKDYDGAITAYRAAIDLLPESPMTHETRAQAVQLYADASVLLAHERALEGRIDNAKTLMDNVLEDGIAPDHKGARRQLARLNDPEWYNQAMTPEHATNVKEVDRLLRLAKDYYDLGDFDNSEKQFHGALRIDRTNSAARRGLEEVEMARIAYQRSGRDHTRAKMLREVDELWETEVPTLTIGGPVPGDATSDSTGREVITRKLNELRVTVNFDETTVLEALEFLHSKSIEADVNETDPGKKGVNFILKAGGEAPAGEAGTPAGETPVSFSLQNVPLVEALKYVTSLAGLKYKVDAFSVVVVPQWDTSNEMFTQTFRVPPSFLSSGDSATDGGGAAEADPFGGGGDAAAGAGLQKKASAREILEGNGITFPDGSSAIFQATSSTLIVRNTQAQMELVEAYVDSLIVDTPKQVLVTSKFVEVTQQNTDELGFDWLLGPFNSVGSDRVFASGGTPGNALSNGVDAANYSFVPPGGGATPIPVGANPITAGLRSGSNAIESDAIDGLLNEVASPTAIAPGIFGIAGVFTDPQFQLMIRALKQKKGADLMSAPSVVTRSGQRAKIEIIREFIYPTEYDPPEIPQDFGSSNLGGGFGGGGLGGITPTSVNSFPVTPANPTAFEMRPVGVTLEVDPVVGADGYTIELNIAPEVVEFEGFINYGSPIQSGAIDALGSPTTIVLTENRIEQPVFSSRKLQTAVTIWDGQTVAIGGLIREDVQQTEDKVPFFGDMPLVGRFFKSHAESHFKRNLMIFVKAVLIDPSGQPIHPPVRANAVPVAAAGAEASIFPEN